jgi:hypothetical protein
MMLLVGKITTRSLCFMNALSFSNSIDEAKKWVAALQNPTGATPVVVPGSCLTFYETPQYFFLLFFSDQSRC